MASARVLNAARPHYIRLRTLTIQSGTPLDKSRRGGGFTPPSPLERLREVRLLLEMLEVPGAFLASDHLTNFLWVDGAIIYRGITGRIPGEKPRMLDTLDRVIGFIEREDPDVKDSNRLYREGLIPSL